MEEGIPYFRELYHQIEEYRGRSLCKKVLLPWMPKAVAAMNHLHNYQSVDAISESEDIVDNLFRWYAISRVNDLLLLGFQMEHVRGKWHAPGIHIPAEHWIDGYHQQIWPWIQDSITISASDYVGFFECIGFQSYTERPFSPFYYEIVEVEQAEEPEAEAVVEEVFWPGLMFGKMMFSRAGVKVRAGINNINRQIAEHSVLYFTYWRLYRKTSDLSHGWGSNSQWGTEMPRNYETDTHFIYNVDGVPPHLREVEDYQTIIGELPGGHRYSICPCDESNFTIDERIELLTNRCLIRTIKNDTGNFWPYYDTYWELKQRQ